MKTPPPLPVRTAAPMRARTPSGHDIPIPESVFVALADIQRVIVAQGQRTQTWQANHDAEHKELGETVASISASKRADWGKVIGLVAGSLATIVTTIVAARPTLPAPEVRAVKSLVEVRVEHECDPLPIRSQERFECFQRIYAETERR